VVQQVKNLIAVTNEEDSPLAQYAGSVLPVKAGPNETTVACRTYINTVAALWLLARKWSSEWDGTEYQQLISLSEQCAALLNQAETIVHQWMTKLDTCDTLVFIGHGPHVATARQAAMMLGEWPKKPALSFGLGAFRHGPIEIIDQNSGVVIFTAPGTTMASSYQLAHELTDYGANVLMVENGHTHTVSEQGTESGTVNEFLTPILDVIPAQLFAEALARKNHVPPTFRYIQKVVTTI
jgi:glucosamine--fructose-6-phosphate aminotransferase (isomerizing)